MPNLVIDVKNVIKSYPSTLAVDELSFSVDEGTCFGLLGPNGAGKTTMMKILYGMASRDSENQSVVNVFGYDPRDNELEIKFISGIVPQEDNLDQELSVEQNLLIYSRFYGMKKKIAQERIDYLLHFMELSEKRTAKIRELSGGMKRRLTIARALLNDPKLLILDEPTTGLDPQVRHIIWDKIRKLKREGVTVLLTTHYMDEAFQMCDRLIIMNAGRAVLEGHPATLINQNMETYVLEIFNSEKCSQLTIPEAVRTEETEGRLLLYSQKLENLESVLECFDAGDFYLRQTNLEDLFLKSTGRHLNE